MLKKFIPSICSILILSTNLYSQNFNLPIQAQVLNGQINSQRSN